VAAPFERKAVYAQLTCVCTPAHASCGPMLFHTQHIVIGRRAVIMPGQKERCRQAADPRADDRDAQALRHCLAGPRQHDCGASQLRRRAGARLYTGKVWDQRIHPF